MMAELQAKGAVNFDVISDILWYNAGFKLGSDFDSQHRPQQAAARAYAAQNTCALPNVTLLAGCSVEDTVFDAAGGRVRAARIRHRASGEQSELPADLVVEPPVAVRARPSGSPIGAWEVAASEVRIDFSFNPIYAPDMSVAFCEGKALDECLAAGDDHSRAALLRAHL